MDDKEFDPEGVSSVPEGHLLRGREFVGITPWESGLGDRMFTQREAHTVVFARTGAGKFLLGALQAIFHPGSAVVISPKAGEWDNFSLARRVDPSLWNRKPQHGRRLGIKRDPRSQTRFHIRNARAFKIAPGVQSVYPTSCHNLLSDVLAGPPGTEWSRLIAVNGASFPDDPKSSTDKWFYQAPTGAMCVATGHLLTADPNPGNHNLPNAYRRLIGIDPNTGAASAAARTAFLRSALKNPSFGGKIQAGAASIMSMGDRAFGSLQSQLDTLGGWMLDERYEAVLCGPSDFSYEEVGIEGWPVTVYISPVQGEVAGEALLRAHLDLSTLVFQQRSWTPKSPIKIYADEIGSWGKGCRDQCLRLFMIGRSKNISLHCWFQGYKSASDCWGNDGASTMVANSAQQVFGVKDSETCQFIRDEIGKVTIHKRERGSMVDREVEAMTDYAIRQELSMLSPYMYCFNSRGPFRLIRPAFKALRTKEGASFIGMPVSGHYDEF